MTLVRHTGVMPARLVVIGSGETSPTMVKVHRVLLDDITERSAVMLDTPFGFQANADDLTDKIRTYFAESVGRDLEVARWRRRDEPATERERTLARLRRAEWVFAGPGSPSYALRQWQDTPVADELRDVVERGGTLVVGSAAAVTIGELAVPVYEIYKVGADPEWIPGLNLLHATLGLRAAVIPHYDNREGGRHDTRFCYLGATRLEALEVALPDDIGILGVDEHTAVVFDLESRTASVHGAGGLTVRHRGRELVVPSGESLSVDAISDYLRGASSGDSPAVMRELPEATESTAESTHTSLGAVAQARSATFHRRLDDGDANGALAEALALEEDIHEWSADTLQGSDLDVARAALRTMLVALATAAESGLRNDREVIGPYVEVALMLRQRARENRDFATSDIVRDSLAAAGVEVRDTPDGVLWTLAGS